MGILKKKILSFSLRLLGKHCYLNGYKDNKYYNIYVHKDRQE